MASRLGSSCRRPKQSGGGGGCGSGDQGSPTTNPSGATAMLRLGNCLLPLLRAASPLPFPVHPHECRLLSTSTVPFSLEDYLVASCGLAPAQAREVSKKASRLLRGGPSLRLSCAANPDAILTLLSGAGLSRADIAAAVSADPLILRASVNNIAPRLAALRDQLGLSTPEIARFLVVGSQALRKCDVIPRLQFFISFYGSVDKVLVVAKRCNTLLLANIESLIKPNIALLHQWGVRDVVQLCTDKAWLLTFNTERVKEFLLRAEQLGVPPTSRMFRYAVAAVADNTKEKVAAKLDFLERTLGCSSSEVSTAVSKMPTILGLSHEIIRRKIEFLVNEAGMQPRYIVERPVIFTYSVEKRLVPRHYVIKVLQGKGLLNTNMSFFSFAKIGEETFKSKFVDCHVDSVPGLADAYAAARAGIVPSRM